MGVKIAKSLVSDNILDYIELAPDYSIIEIVAADKWIGKNLRQLNFRARYGVNVMAVKHGLDIQVAVGPEETIREGDVLVVIGHNDDLNRIDKA
jgi:trk system potassium uptake protein TrkA